MGVHVQWYNQHNYFGSDTRYRHTKPGYNSYSLPIPISASGTDIVSDNLETL